MNFRDREGLWKVNKDVQKVFIQCEKIFRAQTHTFKTSVDCKAIVTEMLQDMHIISCFKTICLCGETSVFHEISFNVLESILTLFTRIRAFPFAGDICEKHTITKNSPRNRL